MAYMNMSKLLVDKDVRGPLHEHLRTRMKGMFIHEMAFPVGHEEGRADVVVVNSHLHCFEIKSDADSLARLPRQVRLYGKVMNYLSMVVTSKHVADVTKGVPSYWGIYLYNGGIEELRSPALNPDICTKSLAGVLWKDSALQLLAEEGYYRGLSRKSKGVLHARILEVSTHERIHGAVLRQFRSHRRSI